MKKALLLTTATMMTLTLAAPSFAAGNGLPGIYADEAMTTIDRRKPRVPGGSGCDDPEDIIEHPECRR
ncbi:MAG: hypothetical protein ACRCS0_12615 [Albidovulum sp.]